MARELGAMWSGVTQEVKDKYEIMALKDKDRYEQVRISSIYLNNVYVEVTISCVKY